MPPRRRDSLALRAAAAVLATAAALIVLGAAQLRGAERLAAEGERTERAWSAAAEALGEARAYALAAAIPLGGGEGVPVPERAEAAAPAGRALAAASAALDRAARAEPDAVPPELERAADSLAVVVAAYAYAAPGSDGVAAPGGTARFAERVGEAARRAERGAAEARAELGRRRRALQRRAVTAWIALGAVAVGLALLLAASLTRRFRQVRAGVGRIATHGAAAAPLTPAADDELSTVEECVERLRRALAAAAEAGEPKTRFVGHVAHEFRTPLSSIVGFASLLAAEHDRLPEGRRAEYLDILLRNARHLLHVTNDLLNLSKVEAGTLEVTIAPVAVRELVDAVAESLQPQADESGLRLSVRVPRDVVAAADAGRLRQVVFNLVENAVKYSPPGGRVEVRAARVVDAVRIEVEDEGPGIAPEDRSRLFREFSRLNPPGAKVAGAGLGLALSKNLVERMEGTIGVESAAGRGSVFWVSLPAAAPGAVGKGRDEAGAMRIAERPRSGTVAIVDDDADIRTFAAAILERAGYGAVGDDGAPGVAERLAPRRPVLVLLDLNLERRDGRAALAELRGHPAFSAVPVLAFTAAVDDDPAELRAAGFADRLVKPVEPRELVERIDRLVGEASVNAPDASPSPAVVDAAPSDGPSEVGPRAAPPADGGSEAPSRAASGETDAAAGDDDFLAPLRARFVAGLGDRRAEIEAARAEGDGETLQRAVHKLRGAASGYGFAALAEAAAEAEEALRAEAADAEAPLDALLRLVRDAEAAADG